MKNLKILIAGAYGVDNWGDEAILDRILFFIRRDFPKARIRVLSGNPSRTVGLHHAEAAQFFPIAFGFFHLSALHKTFQFFKEADAVVLGGGGLFHDSEPRGIFLWSVQCLVAIAMKKPLFVLGISAGPLRRWWFRRLVHMALNHAEHIVVRDRSSYNSLVDIGLDPERILVSADMALLIPRQKITAKRKKVVLSLRQTPFLRKDFPIVISQFVGYLVSEGYRVELISMQNYGENCDPNFAMKLAQNFPIFIPQTLNEALNHIAEAEVVIGMRLHTLIMSATQGIPFLGLSYSPKVQSFCDEIGVGEFTLSSRKANFSDLVRIFEKLVHEWPEPKLKEMRARAEKGLDLFRAFLMKIQH
ncbi:MAG: polysaccharide pyruvyl transferase family protein [Patescibacteria group bacterium]|nr:polysaccharide pyruvyl transferase family protein [Patescibacteria group bacterium]